MLKIVFRRNQRSKIFSQSLKKNYEIIEDDYRRFWIYFNFSRINEIETKETKIILLHAKDRLAEHLIRIITILDDIC